MTILCILVVGSIPVPYRFRTP